MAIRYTIMFVIILKTACPQSTAMMGSAGNRISNRIPICALPGGAVLPSAGQLTP